jgi:hypothetical protein
VTTAALRITSADLIYDAATHSTIDPLGNDVPHVTKVLAETGVATDFEQVMAISRRLREAVEDRRVLGSVVHEDLHKFDDGDLAWETVDPRVAPYISAWETCRINLGLKPLTRERQIYHRDGFTGFLDGIFEQGRKRILGDFKLGDPAAAACRFQTAAYCAAYLDEHPDERIDDRCAIQLLPDRPVPYRIIPYGRDWRADFRKFQCFLTTYREQAIRRSA